MPEIGFDRKSWSAQYKSPHWQRKRLEALNDAGFSCQVCQDKETTLHVHHKRYVKGRKIWEYEISELMVLCAPCHEATHGIKDLMSEILARVSPEGMPEIISVLAGYVSFIQGPAAADARDVIDAIRETNPGAALEADVGEIAALASNRLSMGMITELRGFLESASDKDSLLVKFDRKPVFCKTIRIGEV